MRKVAGIYMTEVRYQELYRREAVSKLSPVQKVNKYFFGETEIAVSDAVLFYGFLAVCTVAIAVNLIVGS